LDHQRTLLQDTTENKLPSSLLPELGLCSSKQAQTNKQISLLGHQCIDQASEFPESELSRTLHIAFYVPKEFLQVKFLRKLF